MFETNIKNYIPNKIICAGMNYKSHFKEQDGRFPNKPVLFGKANSSVIKNGDNILCPNESKEIDYEVELAVIISREMSKIAKEEVEKYIYGYTILNDITARDIQISEHQWYRAKSFDTFGPIGPTIVKKDEIKNPQNLYLKLYVNDELRQDGNTSDMIMEVFELISYISLSITLKPGDLISTGTPSGVGVFMKDKKFLKPGDKVVCEIEKIGILRNNICSKSLK